MMESTVGVRAFNWKQTHKRLSLDEELLLFGYCHQCRVWGSYLPSPIVHLCAAFFVTYDEFDAGIAGAGIGIELLNHNSCLSYTCATITAYGSWRAAYGKQLCTDGSLYRWKLQYTFVNPHQCESNSWKCLIGVRHTNWSTRHTHCVGSRSCGYGFVGWDAKTATSASDGPKYGERFSEKGDTIEVILDLRQARTLSYIIKGKDYGAAFDKLPKGKEWRLAISLCEGRAIQLM